MHVMRTDGQGNPQIKNGVGGWKTPLIVDGKFFQSSKDVAKKLKVTSGTVATAVAREGTVKGKPVRRATEEEIRKNVEIADPLVYRVVDGQVEIRGASGHWSKTVVYDNTVFTIPELAEELGEHQSVLYEIVRNGGDEEVAVAQAKDMPSDAIRVYPETPAPKKNKKREAAVKREAEKKKKLADAPFMGVRWPNGAVDVRFADGSKFMTRDSDKDLPDEVRKLTRWL